MRRTITHGHLDVDHELEADDEPRPARMRILHPPGESPEHVTRRGRHEAHRHLHDVARGAEPDDQVLGE